MTEQKHRLAYKSQELVLAIAELLADGADLTKQQLWSKLLVGERSLAVDSVRKVADEMAYFGILARTKSGYRLTDLGSGYLFDDECPPWPWVSDLRELSAVRSVPADYLKAAEQVQADFGGPGVEILARLASEVERELGGRRIDAIEGTAACLEMARDFSKQPSVFADLVESVWRYSDG